MANEAGQIPLDCLSIPLVLRKIFNHFDNKDLMELSRVNKFWNYEARSLMRERGNLIAYLKSNDGKHQPLESFVSDLQQMNVVPFSGVRMVVGGGWGSCEDCQLSSTPLPDQINILDRLSWKHFSCKLNGLWAHEKSQWILLVKKILQDFSGRLEQMSISVYYKRNEAIEQVLHECSFSRLKILKLGGQYDVDDSYIGFLKTLVSHAPNLQELHEYASLILLATVLEGSSARLMYSLTTSYYEVPEDIIAVLRLEQLKLDYNGEDINVQRFNRIVPQLLQMSSRTLRSMQIDAVLAVPLMCYGICLSNVTELSLTIDFRQLQLVQPRVLRLVKDFDFTRTFPSLKAVVVECLEDRYELHLDDVNALIEQANGVLNEPLSNRAANTKHLCVPLEDSTVGFFAEMFPDIEKLSVRERQVHVTRFLEIPFGLIWTHWKDLKELVVSYSHEQPGSRRVGNLDGVFCGIFPEEVAQLREKDEEYLKAVNIVPVMPSITRLNNLRTIKVHCGEVTWNEPNFEDPEFIFSKVTQFVAFRRCPELVSVTLESNTRGLQVSHMDLCAHSTMTSSLAWTRPLIHSFIIYQRTYLKWVGGSHYSCAVDDVNVE